MQLTNFEKKVLSPGYPRTCLWHYLYLGLAFVAAGAFILYYGFVKSLPSYEEVWERSASVMEKVVPDSPKDQRLLDMAISNMRTAREGWTNFMQEKTKKLSMIFAFIGFYLITAYFREKRYRKLLLKMNLLENNPTDGTS